MRRLAQNRVSVAAAGLVLASGVLGGCIDSDGPEVWYENRSDVALTVAVVGVESSYDVTVSPRGVGALGLDACVGDGLEVRTADGAAVGAVQKPACPGWRLTIGDDFALTYAADSD